MTPSAGAVLLPKDSEAQRPDRIHLCGPPLLAPLQTPWAPLLIIPHPPVINACLLQQVKPFRFEEGRNYVEEKCNYSGLQPASFRLKDEASQKQVEKSLVIREVIARTLDLLILVMFLLRINSDVSSLIPQEK